MRAQTFNGDPCEKCGGTERYEKNGLCVACRRKYYKDYRKRSMDRIKKSYKKRTLAKKETLTEYSKIPGTALLEGENIPKITITAVPDTPKRLTHIRFQEREALRLFNWLQSTLPHGIYSALIKFMQEHEASRSL